MSEICQLRWITQDTDENELIITKEINMQTNVDSIHLFRIMTRNEQQSSSVIS